MGEFYEAPSDKDHTAKGFIPYKRIRKTIKQVKGFLGRVLRDIDRQVKRQGLTLTQ